MSNPAASALAIANLSHPGMVRTHNEDAIFVDGAGLAVLADGMGGYNAGELIVEDSAIVDWVHAHAAWLSWAAPTGGVVLVVGVSKWLQSRQRRHATS